LDIVKRLSTTALPAFFLFANRRDEGRKFTESAWYEPRPMGSSFELAGARWSPQSRRRRESVFAAAVGAAHLAVTIFATATHEMWRDELHCWLVARDSPMPWDVVHERAYDGQPPLWYLLLWPLTRITWHPELMRAVHTALATALVVVFARFAPLPRAARALFAFGYFTAYEYAALSRCYGLALLFALLLCVNHPRRFTRPFVTGGLLAALALTTTVATLVAAAYSLALLVDAATNRSRAGATPTRAAIALGLAAAGGVAAGVCAWPPPDSTVARIGVAPEMPWEFAATRVVAALVPVPRADFFFWNSNALLGSIDSPAVRFALAVLLFAWVLYVLSFDGFAVLLFAAASLLLVGLFSGVYSGSVRHHGFIFVAFVMAAWIASIRTAHPRSLRQRALAVTLLAVLAVHVPGAAVAIAYDARYIFSSGKRAADEIRARGLEHTPMVAEFDFPAIAVLGQLGPGAFAYTPRTGRRFSFVKWTADRLWEPTDAQSIDFAARLGAERGEDPVLVMNRPLLPPLVDGHRVVRLAEKYDSMIEEENFYIYRVARDSPNR
jgi:hypothetical protein